MQLIFKKTIFNFYTPIFWFVFSRIKYFSCQLIHNCPLCVVKILTKALLLTFFLEISNKMYLSLSSRKCSSSKNYRSKSYFLIRLLDNNSANISIIENSSITLLGITGNLQLIGSANTFILPTTNRVTVTTDAQTINKARRKVNFSAGTSTLVVTNSFITTASLVQIKIEGNDATAKFTTVPLSSGSFTIILNTNATAETKVSFIIIN